MKRFMIGDKVQVSSVLGLPCGMGHIARLNPAKPHQYAVYINGSGVKEWYHGQDIRLIERRGSTIVASPEMAHVKLKLSGTQVKIEMFHFIMAKLDPDWPWQPTNGWKAEKFCAVCGGAIYLNPNFSADDVRKIAKQIDETQRGGGGLKLKLKRFNVKARCSKDDPDLPDEPEVAQEEVKDPPVVVVADEGGEV